MSLCWQIRWREEWWSSTVDVTPLLGCRFAWEAIIGVVREWIGHDENEPLYERRRSKRKERGRGSVGIFTAMGREGDD